MEGLLIPMFDSSLRPKAIQRDTECTVGRSRSSSICISNIEVSRCHFIIYYKCGWKLLDQSSSGTWLNDFKLDFGKDTPLKDDDKIIVYPSFHFVFCTGGKNCPNKCKEEMCDEDDDVIIISEYICIQSEKSMKKAKCGVKELQVLEIELNRTLSEEINGLIQKFEEQTKSQTPDEIERLKKIMEAEKAEIKEKYAKEIAELGKRLDASQRQIDHLHEQRGKDSEKFEEIVETELQCCICNQLFVYATTINCSHTFCDYCIKSWLRNSRDCPLCRAPVTTHIRALVIDSYIDTVVATLSDEFKERRRAILAERQDLTSSPRSDVNRRRRR